MKNEKQSKKNVKHSGEIKKEGEQNEKNNSFGVIGSCATRFLRTE